MVNQRESLGNFFYNSIWQVLKNSSDITEEEMIASKTSLELAIGLGFIGNSISSPDIAVTGFSVTGLATRGIKFYQENTDREPGLEEYLLIVYRLAYIESFEYILRSTLRNFLKDKSHNITNEYLLVKGISKAAVFQEYKDIENKLDFELTILDFEELIDCFRETKIAKHLNRNFLSLLKTAGLTGAEVNIFAQRVTWNTQRYLDRALTEIPGLQTKCIGFRRSIWSKKLAQYQIVDDYLEIHLAKKSQEKVFTEKFTFQDIYVPLKAQPLDNKGQTNRQQQPVYLENWVKNILQNPKKQDKVILLQAEKGKGKTVFCRIFAEEVRQNLYPIWTPVLINLRNIKEIGKQFEDTLKTIIHQNFCIDTDNWLKNKNIRYLFLLDGLDDLLKADKSIVDVLDFLKQVAVFQESCQQAPIDKGHRVLITTQNVVLQSIESNLPTNLERVKILSMDNQVQKQWLNNWSTLVGAEKSFAFQQFLQDKNCPNIVQELAQEPLLLYLLAAIHRDGELTVEMFALSNGTQAKIKIYQQALKWVFPKQKYALEFIHKSFSDFLSAVQLKTKLEQWINSDLYTTGFNVPQSILDSELYDLLGCGGLKPEIVEYLMSLLATEFSLKPSLRVNPRFEVSPKPLNPEDKEKSLSANSLGNCTKTCELTLRDVSWERNGKIFQPVQLFKLLEDFYQRWCEGEFIDTHEQNLPQKKSLQLQLENIRLGQRQVDIYVGLNLMILLLELHRITQEQYHLPTKIIFNQSGEADEINPWQFQLLRIINYSNLIHPRTFNSVVGEFLRGANLRNTDLRGVCLSGANLRGADLRSADLRGADLSHIHLSGADLSNADLRCVNLKGANLRGANLSHAHLMGANLNETDLRGANLSSIDLKGAFLNGANLKGADLSGIDLKGIQLAAANLNNVNFSNANLSNTDFRGAQLNNAYLRGANLIHTDLRGGKLSNADLRNAQLSHADLRGAHLKNTHLSNANLNGADIRGARLIGAYLGEKSFGDILWNQNTKWEGVRGWKTAHNIPETLKQELGLEW